MGPVAELFGICLKYYSIKLFRALVERTICPFDCQVVFGMRDGKSTWYLGNNVLNLFIW